MEKSQESKNFYLEPLVGKRIPDFELECLQENEFRKFKFSDYKGKWLVLLFYPADFTFICPTELGAAADNYEEFKKSGAEVFSLSTDTVFSHKAWKDASPLIKKIKFPMAADPAGKLCRALGTYIEEEGMSLRATFIADPEGTIKFYEVHDNSIGRNIKEILRKLQAVKFVRENNGQVCPANWEPGRDAIKPGVDLVGKI